MIDSNGVPRYIARGAINYETTQRKWAELD